VRPAGIAVTGRDGEVREFQCPGRPLVFPFQ